MAGITCIDQPTTINGLRRLQTLYVLDLIDISHLALTGPQKESYPLPVDLLPRDFKNRNRESRQRSEEPSTIILEVGGLESLQDP